MSEPVGEGVVPEASLGEPADLCPVCGAWAGRAVLGRLQSEPPVHLVACRTCGAASADRFPDAAWLKALYAPDRYSSDLLSSDASTLRCGGHVARCLPLDPDADLRVLDYGGGDGGLSRALRDALRARGHRGAVHCTVVDFFVDERSADDVRFLDVDAFAQEGGAYDVVLASAVLEHLTDLPGTARRLLRACRTGGLFYARTPWEWPLASRVPGYAIRWPRHLHDLGPRFWAGFLGRLGFQGRTLRSAPSVVESDLASRPLRTLLAHLLKAPGHLEARLLRDRVARRGRVLWPFVGGWEVVLRVDAELVGDAPGPSGDA